MGTYYAGSKTLLTPLFPYIKTPTGAPAVPSCNSPADPQDPSSQGDPNGYVLKPHSSKRPSAYSAVQILKENRAASPLQARHSLPMWTLTWQHPSAATGGTEMSLSDRQKDHPADTW